MVDISIKHAFQSAKADGPDSTLIRPSNWNDEHPIELSGTGVLGRETAGAGPAELMPLGDFKIPAGTGAAFFGAVAPSGWFMCDGSLKLRLSYPDLFAAIGTAYNTGTVDENSTNFRLPDARGRVIMGLDGGIGRVTAPYMLPNGNTLGATGGEQAHPLTELEMPEHDHPITDPGHTHTTTYGAPSSPTSSNDGGPVNSPGGGLTTSSNTTGITVGNAGRGDAHNTMQPTLAANWIIKY